MKLETRNDTTGPQSAKSLLSTGICKNQAKLKNDESCSVKKHGIMKNNESCSEKNTQI